jgi:hypothetical protein
MAQPRANLPVPRRTWTVSPSVPDAQAKPGERRERYGRKLPRARLAPDPAHAIEENPRRVEDEETDVENLVHAVTCCCLPILGGENLSGLRTLELINEESFEAASMRPFAILRARNFPSTSTRARYRFQSCHCERGIDVVAHVYLCRADKHIPRPEFPLQHPPMPLSRLGQPPLGSEIQRAARRIDEPPILLDRCVPAFVSPWDRRDAAEIGARANLRVLEEQPVHDREGDGVGADADGERQHGRQGEDWPPPELPDCVFQV